MRQSDSQERVSSKVGMVIFICCIAALAGLLFGLDIGYVNGALVFIKKDLHLSTPQTETVTSILMFGAAGGAIISGFLSNFLGRKLTLVVSAILFTIFSIVGMTAHTLDMLLFSRFMLGIGIGIASFIAPLYLSEIAPKRMRGGLIATYQLMITIGIFAMFVSNYYFTPDNVNDPANYGVWRIMMITIVVPAVIMLIGCLWLPQSPRWLVLKGNVTKAQKTLSRVRHANDIQEEIAEIKSSVRISGGGISGLWKTSWLWKVIVLGIVLQILQQFSGMNAFMYYSTTIFKSAGFVNANENTIIVGLVNVLTTFIAIFFVDKLGRKPILYAGLVILSTSLFVIGYMFNLQSSGYVLSSMQHDLMFGFSLLFIFGFAVSLGPIIWILCAEICPLEYRDVGIAFSTATNWIANMIIGRYTLSMFDAVGHGNTFYIFAICCVMGLALVKFFTPETKNVSLEHMEKNLKTHKPLRKMGDHYEKTA